ncbi:MAG: hypothetical protein M3Y57_18015 [Acidobacteriota bacterium]|nr:hypothetical protein [Acidobacteriota bacterium]
MRGGLGIGMLFLLAGPAVSGPDTLYNVPKSSIIVLRGQLAKGEAHASRQ